ncbi:chemotaxis protein CheW [Niveibacterium terrae]|uniref:chemotaxis protein CheW n=1 Tax=Niveibacterium terrae TaxID=3373598 RepID=UPI003A8E51B3
MQTLEQGQTRLVAMTALAVHSDEDKPQYLTFMLDDGMFGINILSIREIIEYGSVTQVPLSPPYIRGVLNLRGAVVPVLDLKVRFGRQAGEDTRRTCIVIVEIDTEKGRQQLGMTVDSVNEVLDIPTCDIKDVPEFGARIRGDFIEGMGRIGDEFVVLINPDRVLSLDEISVLANLGKAQNSTA